ncbi:hypothetical protein Q8A67_025109 [Cirrhinus molitorella]|uniref:Uncharacterized protein n=1 Tax=Cirrhinus molitorella TaxID=172907 RepID=A0AA88NZF9_9TELE|nr:hypothetical protein Q8A67_025109 [Cirrhinus molitorella]
MPLAGRVLSIIQALDFLNAVNERKPCAECRREKEHRTGTGRQLHRVGTAAGSPVGIFLEQKKHPSNAEDPLSTSVRLPVPSLSDTSDQQD